MIPNKWKEAQIMVSGQTLTFAQSMTLRVALTSFVDEMSKPDALGSDETGRAIAAGYRERGMEILRLILGEVNNGQ